MSLAAGFSWGVLLVVFFVLGTALSRYGGAIKALRTESVVAKGGERDALQVLANGGVFAASAALWLGTGWSGWMALAAGSLAASASDTWSTEIGTLSRTAPRSVLSWRPVAPGTSGGVTALGSASAVAGAASIAATALACGWPWRLAVAAFAGGLFGSTLDSVLGASIQGRRWCDRCNVLTERVIHRCGDHTRGHGGLAWMDNDAVNLVSSVAGGMLALVIAR